MLSWPVIAVMWSWAVGYVRLEHFGNCHFLHHIGHNSKSILAPGHQHPLRQWTVQGQALEEEFLTSHQSWMMKTVDILYNGSSFHLDAADCPSRIIASFVLVIHDYLYVVNSAIEASLLNNSASFMNIWFFTSKQTVIFKLTALGTSHLIKCVHTHI